MNNFWSLPKLYDEYNCELKPEMTPSHISIQFSEQPAGEITVWDYGIFDSSGEAVSAALNDAVHQKNPVSARGELSLDLWEYEGHSVSELAAGFARTALAVRIQRKTG